MGVGKSQGIDRDGMKNRKSVGLRMERGVGRGQLKGEWRGRKRGGRVKDEGGLGSIERVGIEERVGKRKEVMKKEEWGRWQRNGLKRE